MSNETLRRDGAREWFRSLNSTDAERALVCARSPKKQHIARCERWAVERGVRDVQASGAARDKTTTVALSGVARREEGAVAAVVAAARRGASRAVLSCARPASGVFHRASRCQNARGGPTTRRPPPPSPFPPLPASVLPRLTVTDLGVAVPHGGGTLVGAPVVVGGADGAVRGRREARGAAAAAAATATAVVAPPPHRGPVTRAVAAGVTSERLGGVLATSFISRGILR